jgi:hypothetical protein
MNYKSMTVDGNNITIDGKKIMVNGEYVLERDPTLTTRIKASYFLWGMLAGVVFVTVAQVVLA